MMKKYKKLLLIPITLVVCSSFLVGCGNKAYQATVSKVEFWGESEWDQALNDATFTEVETDVEFKSLKGKTQVDVNLSFVAGLPLKYDFGDINPSFIFREAKTLGEQEVHFNYDSIEVTNGSGNLVKGDKVDINIKAELEEELSEEDILSIHHMQIRAKDIGGEETSITFKITDVK